ncbi:SAM-dependent methyltransferase [Xanthobacter dioxanivorans]|uniref:SAM-dependent methyltransferase n=1 Tax=Xanthobacter dioxanivorans TaxID=2528964 RepID=A0A974SM28_9HYPH|nr:SAM-dependent methyltransferase [Xanthobacter dioxanivorans]QRG09188.1 SAM-dependent methyltransferase [Xanthobacter dioxanivorans]
MSPPAATFSDDWLALREAADHAARSAALEDELARRLAGLEVQRIVDLGAGTGSNLRALAPRLGIRQHWTLLDHDAGLAQAARARLAAFADAAREEEDGLVLRIGPREIRVDFAIADLAADPAAARGFGPHLVTASAFFDLVSGAWCARFAKAFAGSGILLHAALTCDGRDAWMPPHPADAAIAAGFRAHQGTDKGFGPAAGADAARWLGAALAEAGYAVRVADSPWRLGPSERALITTLADGTARAAVESGGVDEATAGDWARHAAEADACTIGHVDLMATPRG